MSIVSTTVPQTLWQGADCFPYEVLVKASLWGSDPLAGGLAFFFGLIVGGLIGLLCAYFCMKDLTRNKEGVTLLYNTQDQQKLALVESGTTYTAHSKQRVTLIEPTRVGPSPHDAEMKVSIKRKKSARRRRPTTGKLDDPSVPINLVSLGDDDSSANGEGEAPKLKGLADALLQPTPASADAELAAQDLDSVDALEKDLKEENINVMVQMLRVLLQQQMSTGAMKEEDFKDLMKDVQKDISGALATANQEKEQEEAELRKKYEKDPDKLEEELQKLHGRQMSRISVLLSETTDKIRRDIGRNSQLSEDEIDSLMTDLNYNLAESERRLAEQRTKQAMALEERLARRKQHAELHQFQKDQQKANMNARKEVNKRALDDLVSDGAILERQTNDLLEAYSDDQNRLYLQHQEQMERQQLHLAEKLRKNREKKMAQLAEEQELDREEFVKRADRISSTESVRESFQQLLAEQRQQREDVQDDLDQQEADQFNNLLKEGNKALNEQLSDVDERLHDSLRTRAQLSEHDIERIITIHQAEMAEYQKSKKAEKKRMLAKLEEKREQHRQRAEEETMLAQAEQDTLVAQQTSTVNKVLNSQVEMDNDAKERILREHEQQMMKVNNQLQMSKLRQQKALEQRLNKRRARVAELKHQQEQLRVEAAANKEKEKEKLAEQLEKQIKEEEQKLQKAQQTQMIELRRALAEETTQALSEQEKQLSLLISRLEVGQARRKALILKQDKTIKELEAKMVAKVGEGGEDLADRRVDQIINQHTRLVEQLEDKLSDARDRQEANLQERLQAKRLKREQQVEREIEEETEEEWQSQKKRGAGLASSIMSQLMMEQRHKMAMEQLSREMQQEMQKQREELNEELEIEMKAELEERKKSFLAQLAAISNMSKEEVNEVVENAVTDAGGDDKQAKKLTKELRIEMKRARTELHLDASDNHSAGLRRARTDMPGDDDEEPLYRSMPQSGFRRPRSAFRE